MINKFDYNSDDVMKILNNPEYSDEQKKQLFEKYKEDLKLMLKLLKPKYFMPVHGEYRMLKLHTELAHSVGVAKTNTFIMENGDTLQINNGTVKQGRRIETDSIF